MPLAEKLADMFTLEYLEDKSWDMLDALHIGDFFYERGIPPYTFPAAVIVAVIIMILLLFPPPPSSASYLRQWCVFARRALPYRLPA